MQLYLQKPKISTGYSIVTYTASKLLHAIYVTTGVVIAVASLAIIIEVVVIVLRFLNIGLINLKIKIFLIIVSLYIAKTSLTQLYDCVLEGGCTHMLRMQY